MGTGRRDCRGRRDLDPPFHLLLNNIVYNYERYKVMLRCI